MCHSALPELGGCSASVSHWDRVTPSLEGPAHSGDIPRTVELNFCPSSSSTTVT